MRRPSVNFGHARWREREAEAADAAVWLAERPGRALLMDKRAREACFAAAQSIDLGKANRQHWFLVWGHAGRGLRAAWRPQRGPPVRAAECCFKYRGLA